LPRDVECGVKPRQFPDLGDLGNGGARVRICGQREMRAGFG
jgi:hypothetical protein